MDDTRQLLDANVIIRFVTGEPPEMAARAKALIARADAGELLLVVTPVILAESIYTLESFYEMERSEVATKMAAFIQSRGIEAAEAERLVKTLKHCAEDNAHFSDAYLAACARDSNYPIASFDRDFDKFKGVTRIEPTL